MNTRARRLVWVLVLGVVAWWLLQLASVPLAFWLMPLIPLVVFAAEFWWVGGIAVMLVVVVLAWRAARID